jgi:cell division protein FtsW
MHNDSHKERRLIFLIVLVLTFFGALMVYEASSMYAYKSVHDAMYFFKKQMIFIFAAFCCFFLTLLADLDLLRKHNKKMLAGIFFALLLVIFIGHKAGGAKRWITLLGFSFQPSEFLKIFFLLYCCDYVVRKKELITDFNQGLLPLGVVLFVFCILLLIQPDMGSAVFLFIWLLMFLFLYGAKRKHILIVMAVAGISIVFLIVFFPYRFRRITAYLNPFATALESGFQLVQSQIAYGQGGFWGVGLGNSMQKLFFLPAAHTDFIFSIIAEEFGFAGVIIILAVFFLLFHKMFKIAMAMQDQFRRAVLWGVILVFFLEIVINIGVSCGLLPTKGLSLPFISYGGSNLIVHYILLGLFFNASRWIPDKPDFSAEQKNEYINGL